MRLKGIGEAERALSPGETQALLDRKIRWVRRAILVERIWPRLWPPIAVIGVFLIVSLAGLWPQLGAEIHRIVLGGFAVAFLASLVPLARISMPAREEAMRRLEATSGVPHRPATAYEDKIATEDGPSDSRRLWAAHRARMAALIRRLKVPTPLPRVERHDPFALRALMLTVLGLLVVVAGDAAPDRLLSAFRLGTQSEALAVRVDAWLTPPIYTGRQPIMLANGMKKLEADAQQARIIEAPEGSRLVVRAAGPGFERFSVVFLPEGEDREPVALERANSETQNVAIAEFRRDITAAGTVRVLENGSERYSWPIVVIDDRNPSIQLVREPSAGPRGALALAYRVEDDYGVVGAEAGFTLLDPVEDKPLELADGTRIGPLVEAPVMTLKLPRGDKAKAGEGRTTTDLTAHPWAGMRVRMVLRARDQAGQTGESTPSDMVLPGRPFRQPLARALVEQRRKLALTPGLVDEVRLALDALTIAPERFMADAQVYLGIRSVFWRLQYQRDKAGLESAVDQLWQIALRVEDGDLSDAERRLREAQDRLQQALKDGASEEELSQLMAELRDALNEFLKALTAEAQKNPDQNAESPQGSSRMTQQDLEQMLKSIEELAKSGATEDAQQMLSELRDMLERLQAGKQGEGGQAQQQMMETLEKFGGMITRQRKLLDDTFDERRGSGRPGSEGQRGRQTPGQGTAEDPQAGGREQGLGELGQRQGDLRQELDDLMRSMQGLGEEARRRFDDANGAMGQAERSLKEGDLDQATEAQSKALDELRKGAQSMTEQMIGSRQGQSGSQRAGGDDRDPLGRPSGEDALIDSQGRALPSEVDGQRARAILEELRRRLGESTRPATELDYLERLLKKN